MKTTVQVSGLTKRYRAVTALDEVSLEFLCHERSNFELNQ